MKIGIYDPYLDDCGGGEKYMMTIAECLSKDNEVSVFWNEQTDFDAAFQRFGLHAEKIKRVSNIFTPHTNIIRRLTETRKYDCLIILSDGSIPFVFSKKLFLHLQAPMPHITSLSSSAKLKLKRVNKIFVNSQFTKSFIDTEFGVQSVVLYPPVLLSKQNIKKENIILHVGRFRVRNPVLNEPMDDYKKQHVMISAFKDMVDHGFTKWKLVMAVSVLHEDQKAFEEMRETTKEYPIEFQINLSNAALWEFYSKAKIYWHASGFGEDLKLHPERAEHFGISTVEAMGGGAVPVVINAGGQKEIVQDGINGYLWNTISELQDKTRALAEDKTVWFELSEAAKKTAERFSGDRFCEEVHGIIGG